MRRVDLAALLQRTEGTEVASYLEADPVIAKRAGVRVRRIEGVICLGARGIPDPFLNRALGFGTIAVATPSLLDRIERHYSSIRQSPRISTADGSTPRGAMRLLERRGYAPVRDSEELIYGFSRARPPADRAMPGLRIERVGPADAEVYARVAHRSFSERGPQFVMILEALVRRRSRGRRLAVFLGWVDGQPAATGMLFDVDPVGGLGNGSVLPAFRGRGIQTAMIAHRMRVGWARGLRIFFAQTQNPISAHNLEDLGWRLCYRETDWTRPA